MSLVNENDILVRFDRVSKQFHAVAALDSVTFDVRRGEFHAVCGENGAGKSTLMKILSGVIADYDGRIEFNGQTLAVRDTREAESRGISIVHQELNLVGDLSVAANIFLGRERRSHFGWIDDRAMEQEAAAIFSQLDCKIDPRSAVRMLRIGDQQLVEIAKALSFDVIGQSTRNSNEQSSTATEVSHPQCSSRLLIMDEPTSALTDAEVVRLFRIISRLREQGVTIVYISHKMDEIFRHADRITILRDGQVVKTVDRSVTNAREVTHLMVGREISSSGTGAKRKVGSEVLKVERLSLPRRGHARPWRLKDISFNVCKGEVLGIAGLMGAGRTELMESLFGASAEPPIGRIEIEGRLVKFEDPEQALRSGVALVTEDRKRFGIFTELSVREHITLSSLSELTRTGFVSSAKERTAADESIESLRVKTSGREARITSLSGGNQQKCIIARALRTKPKLLLLDDPTRGIDVGAKSEIYRLIDKLCMQGLAIVMTSSELPELMTVCDRIIVLCEGVATAHFRREEFTEQRLMEAATQSV